MKIFCSKNKLEKFLIRALYKIANPFRKLYWFVVRPNTRGVKCLIEYDGKVLLVKLSYTSSQWNIPGGGVKRGEEFIEAARREAWEETGIDTDGWRSIGEYKNVIEYKNDIVRCFHAQVGTPHFEIDGLEVIEARWCKPQDLPPELRPNVKRVLQMAKLL